MHWVSRAQRHNTLTSWLPKQKSVSRKLGNLSGFGVTSWLPKQKSVSRKLGNLSGFGVTSWLPKQKSVSRKLGNLSGFGVTSWLPKDEVYILKVEGFQGILCNDFGTPVRCTAEVRDVLYKSIHES